MAIYFISFLSSLNIIISCGRQLVGNEQPWPLQQSSENQLQLFLQIQIGDLMFYMPL
jgi:hypothetical protein